MFILGIDIGYSNLKIAYGLQGDTPMTQVFPSGVVPLNQLTAGEDVAGLGGILTDVDGESFVSCVSHDRIENRARILHDNFTDTADYKALFMAALVASGCAEIDCLVVGLPVDQFFDTDRLKRLRKNLIGTHLNGDQSFIVHKVLVIPQPIGGYLDLLEASGIDEIRRQRILIIDPGFFSIDWVLVQEGQARKGASGSSRLASSVVFEETSQILAQEIGARVSRERLETVIRDRGHILPLRGQMVDIFEHIKMASHHISELALNEILNSLRREKSDIDVVLLVGGGAEYFVEEVRSRIGSALVLVANDPVMANARGFWRFGEAQV